LLLSISLVEQPKISKFVCLTNYASLSRTTIGTVPCGVNDPSVRNTQGDLYLCRSCEEACFPSTATPALPAPTTASSKAKDAKGSGKNSNKGSLQLVLRSTWSDEIKCSGCDKLCTRTVCVKCDVCSDNYCQQCSTLPKDVFASLLTTV